MTEPTHTFRAVVFPRGDRWYAECLDLSLVVSRPTPEAAIAALQEQVDLHVSTVLDEHLSPALLHRPSPWAHCLRYWRLVLSTWFHAPKAGRPLRLGARSATHG